MNIWAWVEELYDQLNEEGEHRLARQLYALPEYATEDEGELASASFDELLAAARAMRHPWLEIFARHWQLQNRFRNFGEGATAIPEAVSLLEFASRPDAERCPQVMCATEDLCRVYYETDGPGFAPETLAVATEALAGLDPTWSCYTCLSTMRSHGLADSGRPAEALAVLEELAVTLRRHDEEPNPNYPVNLAYALLRAGRVEEGLAALADDEASNPVVQRINKAYFLALLGRYEEAVEELPDFDDIGRDDWRWTEAAEELAVAGAYPNDWRLGRIIATEADRAEALGRHRTAFDMHLRACRLAVRRGARWSAERAVARAKEAQRLLHRPVDAPAKLAAAEASVVALPASAEPPVLFDALAAHLAERDERDPEQELGWFLAACAAEPDEADHHAIAAAAAGAVGATDLAQTLLEGFVRAHPDNEPITGQLVGLLLETAKLEELTAIADLVSSQQPVLALWARALRAERLELWEEACGHCAAAVALDDTVVNTRRLWANCLVKLKRYDEAVELRRYVAEAADEPGDDDWLLMEAATIAGSWEHVHWAARRIGMSLQTESGPIDELWASVGIVVGEPGERRRWFAVRTGPVTARIVSVGWPGAPQHHGDVVVFDAAPLEPPPEDPEEREGFTFTYNAIHTLSEGGFRSFMIDGASPGDEAWDAFRDTIRDRGWGVWIHSPSEYRVLDPAANEDEAGDGDGLPGLWGFVAAPVSVPAAEIDAALIELTAGWPHPFAWLELAKEAGADVARHEDIVERYGL